MLSSIHFRLKSILVHVNRYEMRIWEPFPSRGNLLEIQALRVWVGSTDEQAQLPAQEGEAVVSPHWE